MARSASQLRADVERIWWAGVRAALPERLIPAYVRVESDLLHVGDESFDLRSVRRIAVVGAGKAAGAMVVALEHALGPQLLSNKSVMGWVNVPADCVLPTQCIRLHAARPPGVNEPRLEGVEGTQRILEIVASLGPNDLCFCLLSGGGSALLPAPVPGISLEDKVRATQLLSAAGANIDQLNTVRSPLSLVKGGGLARACRAGHLISMILSDVPGDRLDVIASGPTADSKASHTDALEVLTELRLIDHPDLKPVVVYLREKNPMGWLGQGVSEPPDSMVTNLIIGNNALAVDAAGIEAERLGYSHAMLAATALEGPAEDVGRYLAAMAQRMRDDAGHGPDCLISGGEPTVTLVDERARGKGGRNQQLALAAFLELKDCEGIALLAGGTDGEDGPTDAAGAIVAAEVVERAVKLGLDARDSLRRNDAYDFFAAVGGLFKTGPTQTNVCDLRVVAVERGRGRPGSLPQSHHH